MGPGESEAGLTAARLERLLEREAPDSAVGRLLSRLRGDLLCVVDLLDRGYTEQAGTVVSAMFEIAWTAVYVSLSDDAATRWQQYRNPRRPCFSAWEAALEGLRLLGDPAPDAGVRREYENYRRLCWFKHGHPLLENGASPEFVLTQAVHLARIAADAAARR